MSRRHKSRASKTASAPTPASTLPSLANLPGPLKIEPYTGRSRTSPVANWAGGSWGGTWSQFFEGARRQGYRGNFFFPSLDPSDQMPEMTRSDIAAKVNWGLNNLGFVRPVIDGLALDDVDTGLWPKPATASRAFNRAVKHLWQQQSGYHKAFDAAGDNNFYMAQYAIRREIYARGDCFGAKLAPGGPGSLASCPQLLLVPSWQCSNATTQLDQSLWLDGRMDNTQGRALQFRILTKPDRSAWQDYSADDLIHFHDPFLIGQKRGMSVLAPVVRKMFRIEDLEKAESAGVLHRTRIAFAVERLRGDDDPPLLIPGAKAEVVTDATGGKTLVQTISMNDGEDVQFADLTEGKTIKVIESQHDSAAGAWIKELLTDIAYATLRPPEYIFALAGMSQGTLVRLVQQKVQRVTNTVRDFQIIPQLLDEWYPFWLWQNIQAGNLDGVAGGIPDEWWRYVVIRPRDMTVDPGREGKLFDSRLATGQMPAGLYYGMIYGEDHEEMEEQIIDDHFRRIVTIQETAARYQAAYPAFAPLLAAPTPEVIFRPPAGSAAPGTDTQPEPPDPLDPTDPAAQP